MLRRAGWMYLPALLMLPLFACDKSKQAATEPPSPTTAPPVWEEPIPAGWTEIKDKPVNVKVDWVRTNKGQQNILEFHLTEEHGYAVDGVNLEFWYRFKSEKGDEWVDDAKRVGFFVRERLMPKQTLVASTVLLPIEFKHIGPDLAASTRDNWGVECVGHLRAMEPGP